MFLIGVNASSKWPEVKEISHTTCTTQQTIIELRHLHVFKAYDHPQQIVTDKGPQFTSEELVTFSGTFE